MEDFDKERLGHIANELARNEAFRHVMASLRDRYIENWQNARTVEAREDCHRCVRILDEIEKDLGSIATTGELTRKRNKDLTGNKHSLWRV